MEELTGRRVEIHFLKENLKFTGDKKNPMAVLMLNMLGSFAEFERDLIRERQAEGIALAKASGKTQADVAEEFGISRETLRQYVEKT